MSCRPNFKGETYLVYASEGKKGLEARACSRTRRLSDAGEDLVYLHFVQTGAADSGRIYGFVSSSQLDLRTPHFWDFVNAPVPNLGVRLHFAGRTFFANTNKEGRFVFDGLPAGEYEILVTDWQGEKVLSEPDLIQLPARGCMAKWFYIPKTAIPE